MNMRGKIIYSTSIALILLFGACSNESLINDNDKELSSDRTLSLTATMPGDNITTRVALTKSEDLSIRLTWEVGDQLQLAFVQGETKIKKIVTVRNISEDGKKAQFDIGIPTEITGDFDLYGVYGGGGLSNENPTQVILPTNAGAANSLASIMDRKDMMFYFTSKDVKITDPQISVDFKQLGSLFSITLKNSASISLNGLSDAQLVGVGGDGKWAYNSGAGNGSYDLITGKFLNTEDYGNYISFKAEKNSLASGDSIDFWGWYPPLPEKTWPELALHLLNADGDPIVVSVNTKPARTTDTPSGKSFYFIAEWNGSQLNFVNIVSGIGITDSRDGNFYKIVTIGNQVWMAENLRYLPSVEGPGTGSRSNPYYYVYGYDGTDVSAAKATVNYSTYGVLYNWPAAMAGSPSSPTIPSGVQGVCPDGWHLPSMKEWDNMKIYLVNNGYNYDGSIIYNLYAKALAATTNWKFSPHDGAVGNTDYPTYRNKSGFTGLPGGYRYLNGTFGFVGEDGFWWTATENPQYPHYCFGYNVVYSAINVSGFYYDQEWGISVRCMRN